MKKTIYILFAILFIVSCSKEEPLVTDQQVVSNSIDPSNVFNTDSDITDPDKEEDHDGDSITDPEKDDDHDKDVKKNTKD